MRVIGLDPAYANFGMVAGDISYNPKSDSWLFYPTAMQLIQTKGQGKHKVVRTSSEKLRRAQELHRGLRQFLIDNPPELVFVEVPSGAQNANAAMGLGVAVGILGSIRAPLIEVSPQEIKQLFTKKREPVSKTTIMAWAYQAWPDAEWLTHAKKRTNHNEHLADACATIKAGTKTATFLQLQALWSAHEAPLPNHHRPASGRSRERRVPVVPVSVDQPANKRARRQVRSDAG